MTVTAVSHTANNPKHDITLSDGSTVVGIVVTDANGEKNPRGIQEYPQNRMALKTAQGGGKYDDLELPYMSIVQDDWSGGRGNRVFEDDKSKFFYSRQVDTTREGQVILGPAETYCPRATGFANTWSTGDSYSPVTLSTAFPWYATSFIPDNTFDAARLYVWFELMTYAAGDVTFYICSDTAGSPNTAAPLATEAVNFSNFLIQSYMVTLSPSTGNLTSGTKYWLVIKATTLDVFRFLAGSTSGTQVSKKSLDGTTWSADTGVHLNFRLLPAEIPFTPMFFNYKGAEYMVKRFDSGANSFLFLNGDRGAASSFTATQLTDSSKTWTTDEWANCIVVLIGGPGSEENIPWRTITSNTGTALVVDTSWNITHTTSTEYVILKSNKWTSVLDLGDDVTDVAVCGEMVFFARGPDVAALRYQELNVGGTWTRRSASDNVKANKLQFIQREGRGILYGCTITGEFSHYIFERDIPIEWGSATGTPDSLGMWKKRKLVDTDFPWNSRVVTNVTTTTDVLGDLKIAVAAGFTTGIVAVQDIEPQTIADCNCLGFYIKSSVATSGSNDLYVVLDDAQDLGRAFGASAVFEYDGTTFTDLAKARDGIYTNIPTEASATLLTASDSLFVGAAEPYNKITIDFDAVNNNAATLTAQYYNGYEFVALTITDGTASGGAPFAVDGSITFTIPADWEQFTVNGATGYFVRLLTSADLDVVDFIELYVQRQNNTEIAIPDLAANTWTWVKLNFVPNADTAPKEHLISSIGLKVATDLGAQDIYIRGGIWIGNDHRKTILPVDAPINGFAPYAADGSGIPNLWIFTTRYIFEMQIDNNNAIVQVPIGEVEHMSDYRTGDYWCISDVYLYFSMKDKIERYYNRNLDDVGPDRGDAWYGTFNGDVTGLLAYPGAVYASVNSAAGIYYSGVWVYKNSGWHNVYVGPVGLDIKGIAHQAIPGTMVGRLWIAEADEILWVPTHPDPINSSEYRYTWRGYLHTSAMYTSMADIVKRYKSLRMLFDATSTSYYIDAWYSVDSGDYVSLGTYDVQYREEIDLSAYPSGRKISFLLFMFCDSSPAYTPKIVATILELFGVVPTKYAWAFNTVLKEDYLMFNLQEEPEQALGIQDRAETALSQLKTWANAATPLTMKSRFSVFDNHTVVINPPASNPLRIASEEQHEDILVNITLLEL